MTTKQLSVQELFEAFMRPSNGQYASTIKSAATNLVLYVLCTNSSNVEEAIGQWNELSNFMEKELRARFSSSILRADGIGPLKTFINGDQ